MLTRKNVLDDFICDLDKQDMDKNEFELLEVLDLNNWIEHKEDYLW